MQYIIAFIIFLVVIYIIGVIFSFLWPLLVALIVVAAIGNLIAYQRRKKAFKDLYENTESFQQDSFAHTSRGTQSTNDDVIDVEFTETSVDDER